MNIRYDRKRIEAAVAALRGLPLIATTRAADMQAFQFGTPRVVTSSLPSRDGATSIVGDFALHVQSSWRILDAGTPVVSSDSAQRDELMKRCLETPRSVERIDADERGGLRLELTASAILEVHPDSRDGEHWRLFEPKRGKPHFVVTATGLDDG